MELIRAPQMVRPADTTAYAVGDLVANSTTAGSVVALVFGSGSTPWRIQAFTMLSSNNTVTNKNYQLYLFSAAPTVTNGDNGALAVATNQASFIAAFASTAATNTGGGSINIFTAMGPAATGVDGPSDVFVPGTFYGLLRANAAYTPTSAETFDIWAQGFLDVAGNS